MTCPTKAKKESGRLVFSFATKNKGGGIGKNRDVIFIFKMCLFFGGVSKKCFFLRYIKSAMFSANNNNKKKNSS